MVFLFSLEKNYKKRFHYMNDSQKNGIWILTSVIFWGMGEYLFDGYKVYLSLMVGVVIGYLLSGGDE